MRHSRPPIQRYEPHPSSGVQKVGRSSVAKRLLATVGHGLFLCDGDTVAAKLVPTNGIEHLEWETTAVIPAGRFTVALFGPVGRFHIEVDTAGGTGKVLTSYPAEVEPVRFRREPRMSAPPGAYVHLEQGDEGHRLLDVSDRGVSFQVGAQQAPVVGTEVDAAVSLDGDRLPFRLTIRNVAGVANERDVVRVGASIEALTAEARERWYARMDALRHPWTRTGQLMSREIWDLFEAAGYLALSNKSPADFDTEREAFDAACRYIAARPDVGVQVVFPSPRGLESSITALAEFPNTAVLYHMARRPGSDPRGVSPKTVLRESYEHAISWIARSGLEYLSVWVQDVTRFACGTHRDFAAAHANGYDGCVHSFRALEVAAREQAPIPEGWQVRLAAPAELPDILERFAEHYPSPLPEARAWDATLVTAGHGSRPCAERDRAVIVACRHGVVEAAAILENMPAGMHLFGIFDTFHAVRFGRGEGHGHVSGDGTPALLAFASDWYARRGKRHFVYASEDDAARVPGSRDLGLTHDTVVRTKHLGEFLEHVWHLTA